MYCAAKQQRERSAHEFLSPIAAHGWTLPESPLEAMTGRQSDGVKEDTVEFICGFSTACGAYSVPAQIEFRYYCIKWPDGQQYMNLHWAHAF